MAQYLDKIGLTTLWTKIKYTFALKSHTHKKSEITDLTIPTVNNPTITINQGGTKKGSFSLNQSGAATIDLTDNNTTYTAGTGLSLSSGVFSVKTGYTTSGKNYKVSADSSGNLYVNVPWNNDTWRPVVDNLTTTDATKSLSANQGKVLKDLVDGKADSSHTHNYLPLSGGTIDAGWSKAPLILKCGASNWNEGLRIIPVGNWTTIMLGGNDIKETEGTSANSWSIHNNDGKFYISKNGSDYAPTKLSNTDGTWRVNDNIIIHSGNIGSQNVNYANSAGSANSVAWGNISDKPFSGTSFVSGNSGNGEHNANNAIANGHYYYTSNGPATSLGASYTDGALYVQSHSDAWVGQIAQDYRNGSLFVRGKNNGSWSSWKRIIDSGNIGSQNVNYANSAGSVAWGNVSGRPSSLPASNISMSFSNGVLTITYN